jgi:PBP1b-binding outer membrane lipoprotein LpoB
MKTKLKILTLVSYVICVLLTVSCGGSMKSYEELKRDEKKLVKRILSEKNIEVLKNYPATGVFEENQFVELKSGIYLNVVDSGNGNRAALNATTVLVRVSGQYYTSSATTSFDTFVNSQYPMEFKYGSAASVRQEQSTSYNTYYYFFGIALQEALSYVGDSAVVKMLVPAYAEIDNYYRAGSSFQTANANEYIPIYYDKIKYTFY